MTAISVLTPFPVFTDIDGQPLEDGYVWIGVSGLEPQANPQTAYWDSALTQVVTQPVRTRGGYALNGTAIGQLFIGGMYSIKVQNKNASTIALDLTATSGFGLMNTISFGTTGLTPSTPTGGDVVVAGTLAVANGGTGVTAAGTAGNLLTSNGTAWVSSPPAAITAVTTFSGGTTGLTPSTPTSGAVSLAGTLDVANGGTGQTSYTDGQLLIGNSTGNTLTKATLTAGTGITVTNAGGSITIASSSTGGAQDYIVQSYGIV
jgi:hypothetical protein